ncbi:SEC-C metal-binding domain-containing protein [Jeotgalibacillus malaysiensis]|uniref:SEC-C metal-binding domain-containing protein n=1 Tax=Jeotgalibacillus malaysiensis TaxID=1508404 RepID=UPI00384B2903
MDKMKEQFYKALHHEDHAVKRFALETLIMKDLAEVGTYTAVMQEIDQMRGKDPFYLLPVISELPMSDEEVEDLVRRCRSEKNKEFKFHYSAALINLPTYQLYQVKDKLNGLVPKSILNQAEQLMSMNADEVKVEFEKIIEDLEEDQMNSELFACGKKYVQRLIELEVVTAETVFEQLEKAEPDDGMLVFRDVYAVYMAGEFGLSAFIEKLCHLILVCPQDDLSIHEIEWALIKMNDPKVISEIEKHAPKDDYFYSASLILSRIHVAETEDALIRLLGSDTRITSKTFYADALCTQLSVKAIPHIEQLIEEGYDEGLLSLKESLYYLTEVIEQPHPQREEYKKEAIRPNQPLPEPIIFKGQPVKVEKSPGRNDPCPCGSGKKYKKCCMGA